MTSEEKPKNLRIFGIFTVETPDTAGETLIVQNADISELKNGNGLVNTEHIQPNQIEKDGVPNDFKGFQSVVGRVIDAKKIFGPEDCQTENEKAAWDEMQLPLICGHVEIFDDPERNPNAAAAAGIIRAFKDANSEHKLGFSVEGKIVKRSDQDQKVLERTIIRGLALTVKPANHAAKIKHLVEDGQDPGLLKSEVDLHPSQIRLVDNGANIIDQISQTLTDLKKALTAGGMNAAPGSLVQGGALQKQSANKEIIQAIVEKYGHKLLSKDFNWEKEFPNLSVKHLRLLKALSSDAYMNKLQKSVDDLWKK